MTEIPANAIANYDEPWKAAVEQYFQDFLAFFFPQAHEEIAWEHGYEFLDKEFQQIVRESEVGRRYVDKLVKVWLSDGEEAWLLLHIEIQSQQDSGFSKRMYTYHYRIFDRYDREVVSFAVLGDEQAKWRPSGYQYGRWGCAMSLQFPTVKLLDYAWDDLQASTNPFAVVVMAHRKTQDTTQDADERLRWKLQLIKGLYERGYSRQDIMEMFRLLDWMMRLPEPLELTFRDELHQFEEDKNMPYITSIERIGRQEGLQEGRQEGLQEGRQEGRQEERISMIRNFLTKRFGQIDDELEEIVLSTVNLPHDELGDLLMIISTLSREELLARFAQGTKH